MDDLAGKIFIAVAGLASGYALTFLQPKSKLFFWAPHVFHFNLKDEKINLLTHAVTLQNLGRKTAEKVQIIFDKRPDFFSFDPPTDFQEKQDNNQFVIILDNLGPKEYVTLQMLSYKTYAPELKNIRCESGAAKSLNFQITKVLPKPAQHLILILLLIGASFSVYWLIKAIMFISSKIL